MLPRHFRVAFFMTPPQSKSMLKITTPNSGEAPMCLWHVSGVSLMFCALWLDRSGVGKHPSRKTKMRLPKTYSFWICFRFNFDVFQLIHVCWRIRSRVNCSRFLWFSHGSDDTGILDVPRSGDRGTAERCAAVV